MTDSPVVQIPLDPREQPILDELLAIRTNLELLQQDKSTYVKSQDVIDLYNQIIEQVVILNELRTNKRHEQNRGVVSWFNPSETLADWTVDTVLDDCFQLISLSFLTIGKNHEAPAVYAENYSFFGILSFSNQIWFQIFGRIDDEGEICPEHPLR